ncbi:Mariner Mos1 transposase [Cryptotermes secundus]|uniref:Mariner Mos1 transposase n=2 Tax=Cryptotermes secundus TaxID=105785 RepID=A0A2J7Q9R7_9NEOP|nr:Mariner Mos1 transposase [Cryptotermes secundus]PNF25331.1 Mariner Mos1 transposase [Cryptotermes secundus]PNF37025.1 Mariner Mos1 transposase [Cryptotermes secundus]PNF40184.1 Mariner Mos1 transposase [Cryptotermes secundus]
MDQRICIKFCVKNEIKCYKVCEMLTKAYGESVMSKTRVYEWYKRFQDGREDVADDERPGRPSTSTTDENVEKVKAMIMNDRRITIREVADDVGISIGSCHEIFSNVLGMKRVAAKFVPKLLNFEQKQRRMEVAQESLKEVNDDAELLKRVITGDETWVYGYDVETKAQSSQWKHPGSPRPKKARQVRSNVKVMLTVFFNFNGIVHHEFLPQGQTVNKEYYLKVQRRLREAIRKKRPDLWKNNSWLLHHDNAPAHTSLLVREFLAKNNTVTMPQPPYSPDMAPCDFFLFPKIKRTLKGRRFTSIDDIKSASLKELKAIPKIEFEKCFDDWKKRWRKCIISNGDYFEGDNINVDE